LDNILTRPTTDEIKSKQISTSNKRTSNIRRLNDSSSTKNQTKVLEDETFIDGPKFDSHENSDYMVTEQTLQNII